MIDVREAITQAHHEEWARVVAALTRRFGDLDIAEEAAAEAFATATERWPADGVPPNPGGWLTTTANRKAIDRIRREHKRDDKQREAQMSYDDDPTEPLGALDDDRLRLIFTCCDSIRAFALEAMADAGLSDQASAAHAAWFAAAARTSTDGVRSGAQGEYLAFARTERANIDTALAWTIDHDPLGALDLVNGFGWAWIVLGDSRGAQRILAALDAAGDAAPDADRANALLLAAWIEASSERLDLAQEHIAARHPDR